MNMRKTHEVVLEMLLVQKGDTSPVPTRAVIHRYVYELEFDANTLTYKVESDFNVDLHVHYEVELEVEGRSHYANGDIDIIDGEYEVGGGCAADDAEQDFFLPMDLCLGQLVMFERGLRTNLEIDLD